MLIVYTAFCRYLAGNTQLQEDHENGSDWLCLVTFGSPCVGNAVFSSNFEWYSNSEATSIYHHAPHYPYHHPPHCPYSHLPHDPSHHPHTTCSTATHTTCTLPIPQSPTLPSVAFELRGDIDLHDVFIELCCGWRNDGSMMMGSTGSVGDGGKGSAEHDDG